MPQIRLKRQISHSEAASREGWIYWNLSSRMSGTDLGKISIDKNKNRKLFPKHPSGFVDLATGWQSLSHALLKVD